LLDSLLQENTMLVEEVMRCSFPAWYKTFEKVTIPSVCVPLPAAVVDYLLEDGQLVLPSECNKENYDCGEDDYDEFGDTEWDQVDQETELSQKTFPEFSAKIKESLVNFGGEMFIKLNWSSPKDATWVGFNNSIRCTSLSQLYLLLKSSDFIAHDLTLPFKFCEDNLEQKPSIEYTLVLRDWMDVNPGLEFRCFVVGQELIAVSQRDDSSFYDHILKQEESIRRDIITFFREHIQDKFPSENYVFDVIRSRKDKVILVDFNPFGETTDSLFFTWDELKDESFEFEFRFATDSSGVQPHPLRHYSIPRDFVDLSTGTDPAKLIDFLNLKTRQAGEEDSDSE